MFLFLLYVKNIIARHSSFMRNAEMIGSTTVEARAFRKKLHEVNVELSASEARAKSYAQALSNLRSRLTGDAGTPVGFYAIKRVNADDVEGEQYVVHFPEGRGLPKAIFSFGQRDLTRENFTRCLRQVLAFRNAAMTTWAREFCSSAPKAEIDAWLKTIDDPEGYVANEGRLASLWAGVSADTALPTTMTTLNNPPELHRVNRARKYEDKPEAAAACTPSGQNTIRAEHTEKPSPAVSAAHKEITELRKQLEDTMNKAADKSCIEAELISNRSELARLSAELSETKRLCAELMVAREASFKVEGDGSFAVAESAQQAATPTTTAQPLDTEDQDRLHTTQDLLLALRKELACAQDTDDDIQDGANAEKNTLHSNVSQASLFDAQLVENQKGDPNAEAIEGDGFNAVALRKRKTFEDAAVNKRNGWDLSEVKADHLMKQLSRVRSELEQVDVFQSDLDNAAAGTLTNLLGIRDALLCIDDMESSSNDEADRIAQLQEEIESYKIKVATLSSEACTLREIQEVKEKNMHTSEEGTLKKIGKLEADSKKKASPNCESQSAQELDFETLAALRNEIADMQASSRASEEAWKAKLSEARTELTTAKSKASKVLRGAFDGLEARRVAEQAALAELEQTQLELKTAQAKTTDLELRLNEAEKANKKDED